MAGVGEAIAGNRHSDFSLLAGCANGGTLPYGMLRERRTRRVAAALTSLKIKN
ncbi:hypothetical protein [Komarekiella delphini-convector]|uniref:hypothetical protein n=1 Tax=Komarekiella delphini-convector TaxID=3050158 RepID=UPI00177F9CA1|nr:hypothetical protein [Komarekiella delphini-convector]